MITQTKTKLLKFYWFIVPLILIGHLLITIGSQLYTKQLEKLIVEKQALVYTAPRLWELSPEKQIEQIFGEDARLAEAIFRAESGLNCNAVSSTNDLGIAQIQPKFHAKRALKWNGNLMDCTTNLLVAKEIFDEQGFEPWVSWQNQSYKRFLK